MKWDRSQTKWREKDIGDIVEIHSANWENPPFERLIPYIGKLGTLVKTRDYCMGQDSLVRFADGVEEWFDSAECWWRAYPPEHRKGKGMPQDYVVREEPLQRYLFWGKCKRMSLRIALALMVAGTLWAAYLYLAHQAEKFASLLTLGLGGS